jgi:hypothetical protein
MGLLILIVLVPIVLVGGGFLLFLAVPVAC